MGRFLSGLRESTCWRRRQAWPARRRTGTDFAKTKLFGMNATNKVFLPDDQREA